MSIISTLGNGNLLGGGTISSSGGGSINSSGIIPDMNKLASMPAGWAIVPDYKESWAEDDNSATICWQGPWGNRGDFVAWALGYSFSVPAPAGGGGSIARVTPIQHPLKPWMYAQSAELVRAQGAWRQDPNAVALNAQGGVQVDGNGNPLLQPMIAFYDSSTHSDLNTAVYAVHYHNVPYTVRTDAQMVANNLTELSRYVVREWTDSIQALPLPGNLLSFTDPNFPAATLGDKTIPESAVQRYFPMSELRYRWLEVPDVPEDGIAACAGCVNSGAFDGPITVGGATISPSGSGYAAGTLLCMAPQKEMKRSKVGRICWNISYSFMYRPGGWNNFPAADGKLYSATFTKGPLAGQGLYPTADFSQLFLPPAPRLYQSPLG